MANSYLMLALLLLIPLFAIANRHGIELHQGNPRGLEDIDRILRSANRNLRHYPVMDTEATYYPACIFNTTTLAMKTENAKTRPDDVGIMISKKYKLDSFESIAKMWTENTNFLSEIKDSTVYGCAVNQNCESKDILSCVFDNPPPNPSSPAATTRYNTAPVAFSRPKPYSLTHEMFQDILDQLKPTHPNIYYDNEFFMDHGSASHWQCPFPNQYSDTLYVVGNGRVELTKNDDFGVIMELGRGVPYHDSKMRDAMKNFARKWSNLQFNRAVQIKFGCSVDPDCQGDMILLCAFYPIDSSRWSQNPNIPHPTTTPSPTLGPAIKYTERMNIHAGGLFGLIVNNRLEDECLRVTKCEGSMHYQGYNKTYSGRLGKFVDILTGATWPTQIDHDIFSILNGMQNRKFIFPYQFGCCYIPRCQNVVVSNCVFAEM